MLVALRNCVTVLCYIIIFIPILYLNIQLQLILITYKTAKREFGLVLTVVPVDMLYWVVVENQYTHWDKWINPGKCVEFTDWSLGMTCRCRRG